MSIQKLIQDLTISGWPSLAPGQVPGEAADEARLPLEPRVHGPDDAERDAERGNALHPVVAQVHAFAAVTPGTARAGLGFP
jgi:hypothetical protein